jgi:hypothetical protein
MNYQIQNESGTLPNTTWTPHDKTALGYNFDVTQQLFFSQHMALRLDIKNVWSKQNEMRYYPAGGNADKGSELHQDTTMLLGLNIFY